MKLSAIALLFILTTVPILAQQRARGGASGGSREGVEATVRVTSSNEQGVTIDVAGLHARVARKGRFVGIIHNGARYFFQDDSLSIPGMSFPIGVPVDATDFTVTATTAHGDTIPLTLAPESRLFWSRSDRPLVSVDPGGKGYGLKTVLVRYRPVKLVGDRVAVVAAATIRLSWKRAGTKGTYVPAPSTPVSEDVLGSSVLNYQQARAWRVKPASTSAAKVAAQRTMGEALVMQAPQDGIYRVRGTDLAAAGVSRGMPISDLRIRSRDQYVRFYVNDQNGNNLFDDEDYLEFNGWRNRSPLGFYWDETTDTNAFLLTWHGGDGGFPPLLSAAGTGAAPVLVSYDSTVHAEEEHIYDIGPTLPGYGDILTVHSVDRVVNERYYWRGFPYPERPDFFFNCSPRFLPNDSATIRIRVVGNTFRKHGIQFWLNTYAPLGTVVLPNIDDQTFSFRVPTSYLINGQNKLTVVTTNADTTAVPDYIFVDYIEVTGKLLPTAFGDLAKVRIPGGPARLVVDGMTGQPSLAYSNSRRVTIDSTDRGFEFRLSSRQFPAELRNNAGFVAQFDDGAVVQGAAYQFGTFIAEVDGSTGKAIRSSFFDTSQQPDVTSAVKFLADVKSGNIVVAGFALGALVDRFPTDLANAFGTLGSQVAIGPGLGNASWTFCARKGAPETMQEQYASLPNNNVGVSMNAFIPSSVGTHYRAKVTVDGTAGEEFTLGAPLTPLFRYHKQDDLLDPSNRADLVIITHKGFRSQSDRLAEERRTKDGLTVKVVDVDQVYDEFNDGIKSADAIRSFLQYADQSWADPKPTYVLLFGDASTDPARRLASSKLVDYVPTYGIPASDYMLTVYPGDSSCESHQYIGRISATSSADADAVVDKIIEYDSLPPQWWDKRFVMITGGESLQEKQQFEDAAEGEALFYILADNFQGDTALVHRLDTTEEALHGVSEKEGPWARQEINQGALWVSYSGHGSGNVVELNYGFPEDFDNGNRYFVLTTFSCQTGAFAESDVPVRNERFVMIPGKGAIAAIGGSSFSYVDVDGEFRKQYYSEITINKERSLGAILHKAKYNAFAPYQAFWKMTDLGIRTRNELTAYNLIGDPSMKLFLRKTPELAVPTSDVMALDEAAGPPHLGDSVILVNAKLWNYGLPIDTLSTDTAITVVATIVDLKGSQASDTVTVQRLRKSSQMVFRLPISQQPGEYVVRIVADPEHHINETYLQDNTASITVPIRGNQALVLEPRPFGRVASYDNVAIRLLNPPSGPGAVITVDTTDTFDSPARFSNQTVGTNTLGELTTVWTFSIPQQLRSTRKFWWRAVSTTGDTSVARLFPLVESFTVDAARPEEYSIGGVRQMSYAENVNLASDASGIGPGSRTVIYDILAMGQNEDTSKPTPVYLDLPGDSAVFRKDGRNVKSNPYAGLNVIVVDPETAEVVASGEFAWFHRPYDQQAFLSFVQDSVKPGQLVMMGTRRASFGLIRTDPLDSAVIVALKSLGSTVMDSIAEPDTYILVGGKGIAPGERREIWLRRDSLVNIAHLNPPFIARLRYPITVAASAGRMTLPAIGPARTWRALRLDYSKTSPVTVNVFGIRRDGVRDSLLTAATLDSVDLRGVDATKYPKVELTLRFINDSTARVRTAYVDFDPSPELAIVPSTFRFERDSVLQGDALVLHATVANLISRYAADSVTLQTIFNDDPQAQPIETQVIAQIKPLDSLNGTFTINSDRIRGLRSIGLVVNPADIPSEPYRQNNKMAASIRVGVDNVTPSITLYADGNRLMEGDYVSPEALLEVRVFDNSMLKLADTQAVTMILDNDIITLATPGASFRSGGTGDLRGTFFYKPANALVDGAHDVRLFTNDASGNGDTTGFIRFYVERDLHLKEVVNVPNPFQEKTTFTFMVTGSAPPTGGEIAIFTVAGRKIKSIPLMAGELHVGFNRVEWDGLDADRDRLANGVYLYRITVENGDSKDQVIDKVVVMR